MEALSEQVSGVGNRAVRWLPGLEEAVRSTGVIDRVRWEVGQRARRCRVRWTGSEWVRVEQEREGGS